MMNDVIVCRLDKAKLILAECKDANGAKKVADMAHAVEIYAKRQRLSQDNIDYAHAVKIDALTLLGDFLSKQPLRHGARGIGKSEIPNRNSTPTLKASGISPKESYVAQNLAHISRSDPKLYNSVRENWLAISKAMKLTKRERRQNRERREAARISCAARKSLDSVCLIRHCSMRELLSSGIKIDALIADPPYPKEFLPLYGEMAELSKDIPLVAVMCGQSYLPEILALMCPHLQYRWTMAYLTPRKPQAVRTFPRQLRTRGRPSRLLW